MRKLIVTFAIALGLGSAGLAGAAVVGGPAGEPEARASARPRPPVLLSPADETRAEAVPTFSWRAVRGAIEYEFEVAADRAFESVVDRGSFVTRNTYASLDRALADGTYYWRVRAFDKRGRAGRWSRPRELEKRWGLRPEPLGPGHGATVVYPSTPLVLRWSAVPHAYKYLVRISTDPFLANSVFDRGREEVETSATAFALPEALPAGTYYWAVTPLNGRSHRGARSAVRSFTWTWPTATATRVEDLNPDARVYDPRFSWNPVAGAAQYEVEVNPSTDFAPGSKVCCDGPITGTSISPTKVLPNNVYHWRVRALDVDGNAGGWNTGPDFRKDFDAVTPTIPNLRLRDNENDPATDLDPNPGPPVVHTPIVTWDPVPGASSYEVQITQYVDGGCNWTSTTKHDVKTAATAWTPLGSPASTNPPGGVSFPRVSRDTRQLADGATYCARVLARSDRDRNGNEVVSDWTQLGGLGNPAFTFDAAPLGSSPTGQLAMPSGNYRLPQTGSLNRRLPLFTWAPVAGAASYYVVVAKDALFTNIVDVAFTKVPAYAPRDNNNSHTYADETTSYYWAVMPAKQDNGGEVTTQPSENNPRPFEKRSIPPALVEADVSGQPTFRWTSAEGARHYRLQVAQDPTFGNPIDDVVTASTAYSSIAAYPADTALYWRVRATDEKGTGLTWSQIGTLRRQLPASAPAADTLAGGETIPVLSWTPVQGAVSYDMHVDQADGTTRDFTMRSSAFTPTAFYGTGVWHWQVRANFRSGRQMVSGAYFSPVAFTRRIGTPAGARGRRANGGGVVSWESSAMAKSYRVQISESNSFRNVIETANTDNTSYAPRLKRRDAKFSRLYWRVAVVDEGNNVGGWSTGRFTSDRALRVRLRGRLRRGRRGRVTVRVLQGRRPVAGATVSVTGVARAKRRRTNRRGTVTFRVRPLRAGRVGFRAVKRGYEPGTARLRVR